MKILITGAEGFVGKNLTASLENIRDGKDTAHVIRGLEDGSADSTGKTEFNTKNLTIIKYDRNSSKEELEDACRDCDFVFNLAGVNRPQDPKDFMSGNYGFSVELLELLKKYDNKCPVMLSSSVQATLKGRFEGSEYGKSKCAGEELFFKYAEETGAKVLVYRFPNIFGKWCRPNYNSAVATFCNNIAKGLDYTVNDRNTELDLVYIDDLIEEMINALNGNEHRCEFDGVEPVEKAEGRYCFVPVSYKKTLGEITDKLEEFNDFRNTFVMSDISEDSFDKKLYSMFLSYFPEDRIVIPLKMNKDARGSFTEVLHTGKNGQISVNVSNPGMTKGQHWHHSKWEIFVVVKGHGLIRERQIGKDPETGEDYPIMEFEVDGENLQAVYTLPGYAHSLVNLSDKEELITLIWANESFDPEHPDTYREFV